MGWTYMRKPVGKTPKQYMDSLYTWENDKMSAKVLDSAMVGYGEYYAAVEKIDKATGERVVFAGVAQVRNVPRASDGYTFGYKDMDETVGPYFYRAPLRIMKLLTPTNNEHAKAWREKVAAYHAKPKPKKGQTVVFANPIKFTNGAVLQSLVYDAGSRFRDPVNGWPYRVSGWKDRAYSVA